MQEETTPVQFVVICGKHSPDGTLHSYSYAEQAPTSFCKPHGPVPNPDAMGMFLTSLVERHHYEVLSSRAWRCVACDKRATELFHSAVPLLSLNVEGALPGFGLTVVDNAAPICFSGGACDQAAKKLLHDFAKSALLGPGQTWEESKCCDKCGKRSDVKLCGGCKVLAYCSKECQAQSWPYHKKACKKAQKEQKEQNAAVETS